MDPSSAIRPEASTVSRQRPDEEDMLVQNEGSGSLDDYELEAAETVIRQDPLGSLASGSSRREAFAGQPGSRSGVGRSDGRGLDEGAGGSSRGSGSGSLPQPSDHTPASLTRELTGQQLNHFSLIDQIGGGGMGAVFRAVDERLGRTVAVKVVPFASGDPDLQRRFRNEAQSAAKLDHPLIARVFEVGNDGSWYYIVFEYIDGRNIRDIVSQNGPLSLDDAVYYTCQVAEAIGHAARRGIVHRDVKPSNVVVTEESAIKLVDMGLARSESFETSEDMTASGVTLGTFDYISPEQAHDPRLADMRSDLYSLGCTFFYMLTGGPPYPGGTMLQKLLNHGNAAIPDIRERRDDASDDLAAILRKLLAKQPGQRYQNSQGLIADLQELARRENLPRSRGVDVVTVQGDNALLRRLLRHLPWVVAVSVLLASAIGLEVLSWQPRGEFSAQVAATVSETAMKLAPVRASSSHADPQRVTTQHPFSSGSMATGGKGSEAVSETKKSEASPTAKSGSADSRAGVAPSETARQPNRSSESTPSMGPSGTGEANGNESPPRSSPPLQNELQEKPGTRLDTNPSAQPEVQDSVSQAKESMMPRSAEEKNSKSDESVPGANPKTPAAESQSDRKTPSVAATPEPSPSISAPRRGKSDRLPSDPPSLKNFPLPIGSTSNSDEQPMIELPLRIPSFAEGTVSTENSESAVNRSDDQVADSVNPKDMSGTAVSEPPHSVRIVTSDALLSSTLAEEAQKEGVALAASLNDALKLANQHHVARIEIDTPMLFSEPVVIDQDDLVISSTVPGGTAIVFTSPRDSEAQRSEMLTIGSNRIDLVDVHLYWSVPSSESDGGAMIAMNDNRRFRMIDSTITIDNPSRRDNVYAFNVVTDPESSASGEAESPSAAPSPSDPLPLVSIELYNVIIRGQISMLQMDVAAELQLLWENGLLAVSRRMIETGGSPARPQPKSGSIRLSLQRLTASIPRGLLLMRLNERTPYPVNIERQAEESVFVVDRGVPHVEIDGVLSEDRERSWLRIRGASNAYEADTTLSDPMLVVRDRMGVKNTTTLNDLTFVDQPVWADDRTPRWTVRWSQPLPDSIPVSRLIPADFRQDGSLFAGFQEKSLPKLPMQRTLDSTSPETP